MTKFYASTLALIVATSGAWAESHSTNMTEEDGNSSTQMTADGSDNGMMNDDATGDSSTQMTADNSDNGMMNDDTTMADSSEMLIRTRDITGGNVYTTNEANDEGWDADSMYTEVGSDWNTIGEIEDIVLNENGEMIGIVAEVGGVLDIGDKHVMLPVENVSLVAVDDATYGFVTAYNEEDLEEMDSVDEGFWN